MPVFLVPFDFGFFVVAATPIAGRSSFCHFQSYLRRAQCDHCTKRVKKGEPVSYPLHVTGLQEEWATLHKRMAGTCDSIAWWGAFTSSPGQNLEMSLKLLLLSC